MSKNKTEEGNIESTIRKVVKAENKGLVKDTAKEVIEQLKSNRLIREELPYYKRIEILLYNYENLKDAVLQKDEDIKYLDEHGLPEKSKSIVIYSSASGGTSKEDRYVELREKYKREKIETERDIKKIDNALFKIKKDKYYTIIEMKYIHPKKYFEEVGSVTDEMLGEELEVDRKTIVRNRKRLINKLITIFFPESLKDVM